MPWQVYNPNPHQRNTTDCTVRAVCAVTGLPWRVAHRVLCEVSGELGEMPDRDNSWWSFLRAVGFKQFHLIDRCPDCYTVKDFARDHPKGRYILGPHEHAVAVIDGDWWDTWDSGETVPSYYFTEEEKDNGMDAVQHAELSEPEHSDGVSADGVEPAGVSAAEPAAEHDAADDPGGDRPG